MRKTVKLISLGLAMIILLTPFISCGEIEYALVSSGNTSAEGFTYDLYEDGSAVITGGTVKDGILDIPASVDGHKVKAVGDEAFRSNVEFHYLKIAPSIRKIGKFAFAECQRLTYADVGQPTDVGFCAFYDCKNLTYLRGLDKVKTIEEMAFCGCLCLSSLTLPDTLTSIGERAFAHCVSLPSVRLPRSIKTIGAGVFFSCDSLAYADVSSLKNIPESTFTHAYTFRRNCPQSAFRPSEAAPLCRKYIFRNHSPRSARTPSVTARLCQSLTIPETKRAFRQSLLPKETMSWPVPVPIAE